MIMLCIIYYYTRRIQLRFLTYGPRVAMDHNIILTLLTSILMLCYINNNINIIKNLYCIPNNT
jgi:hypothetical protein